MPMSISFHSRLSGVLPDIVRHYGTPFHIYDETGIRETGETLIQSFANISGFREYFAVKALPNPTIMKIMKDLGFGFDCSSISELHLSRNIGASGDDILFSSNNTSMEEFKAAADNGGCILNLDDISLVEKVPEMPELICFRYNPGPRRAGSTFIGSPSESKYGVHYDQITEAFRLARERGAIRFGLHSMLSSNMLDPSYIEETSSMLLFLAEDIGDDLKIKFEFINIGGGFGIPYQVDETPLDVISLGNAITRQFKMFENKNGYMPKLYIENGRYMTGPHGVLVVKAINQKNIYRNYIGVDASMSALMRPGLYNAYHHITVSGKEVEPSDTIVDVVGSLCENNDKFAVQRPLPQISEKDILIIHDTGAHGHAMGFNYNGRLRPKELLLRADGSVELIRREENLADYFATLDFEKNECFPACA